jgi:hypothetical protein
MFILYTVLLGLIVGVALGGRPAGLAAIRFRWAPLVFVGFVAQVVLFSAPVTERIGDLGAPLYVVSTGFVLLALARNLGIPGMSIVAVGALANFAAIGANGGFMPAAPAALAALHRVPATVYSNSAVLPDPALWPLTDIFALPGWLPLANIFSVGDVLIGLGVAVVIVVGMRRSTSGALTPA